MANTPDYSWPPMDARKVIGTSPKRVDGPIKAAGRAKYTSDLKMKDLLYAFYLTCPHAHARITSIDRKSTRLNSSHLVISYAVFCLKKKKEHITKKFTFQSGHAHYMIASTSLR